MFSFEEYSKQIEKDFEKEYEYVENFLRPEDKEAMKVILFEVYQKGRYDQLSFDIAMIKEMKKQKEKQKE